jgi:hypothetical protein
MQGGVNGGSEIKHLRDCLSANQVSKEELRNSA